MRARSEHRYTWWFRAWWSRNPLLRKSGPAEWVSGLGAGILCLLLVLAVPVAAVATWHAAADPSANSEDTHAVEATAATSSSSDTPAPAPLAHSTRTVQWSWHGEQHTGRVDTTAVPTDGDVHKIRVDDNGELVSPQFGTARVVALVTMVTIASALIALVLAFVTFRFRASWLLRRRARNWEHEWEQVQPVWTGGSYPA